jgi:hypothetical protein
MKLLDGIESRKIEQIIYPIELDNGRIVKVVDLHLPNEINSTIYDDNGNVITDYDVVEQVLNFLDSQLV